MATWPRQISNEGHSGAALDGDPAWLTCTDRNCLLEGDYERSFAFRAARLVGIRGLPIVHDPRSRGDFLHALQQLGAEPKVYRLQRSYNALRILGVHVSCSHDHWVKVFGTLDCVEEIPVPSARHCLHRWKHSCLEGSVTCVGHLFAQSPGVPWAVVTRIAFL
jgi:hypothetical protein